MAYSIEIKTIYASFCGTGKSYLCKKFPDRFTEVECWKYRDGDFPSNYIEDVIKATHDYEYTFISTDPTVLKELHTIGYNIIVIYPNADLKKEYFCRYVDRGSSLDFISTLDTFWDDWLIELDGQENYQKIVLDKGMFLQDVLNLI